ncbi:Hsp70 family protein [Mycobacterium sp. NPDC050041]|uniref:Hsp70 family protein n=1 Tax=Mycobacterium sp. NPDC050041 TaxID=3364293 RepID=UPI003C2F9DCE
MTNTEIFGIDLGTTYSAVARIDEFGMPVVIPNAEDQPTTPSAVYFETPDNVAVGQTAKNSAVIDAENVVTLIKRRMGEDFKVTYHGTEYTPESISALVLKQLMQDAVAQSGVDTNRVVITVPAYFGANEKDSTRKAGEIAGLEVVDIIAEPVAAALAYGMKQTDATKTIFVYDLGGGTFDTTILKISPELLEVVVIDGNRELGGADWDAKLMMYLISEFQAQTGLPDEDLEDENFLQDMAIKAEELKKNLSKLESRQVPLKYGSSSAKITVTREQFEALTADLLGQTIDIVERTLEAAKVKDPGITVDEVLLVGGSSFMPAVAETLKARFGWEPKLSDPNQSVAKGAAIYGATPVKQTEPVEGFEVAVPQGVGLGDTVNQAAGPAREIKTVIPRAIGIAVWCGHEDNEPCAHTNKQTVSFLITKNESLPFSGANTFYTVADGQTQVAIEVYEQAGDTESEAIEDNRRLAHEGGAVITGLSLPKNSPIEIQLAINRQGEADLAAKDVTSGKELKFAISLGVMQQEDVDRAKQVISRITVG